MDFETFFSSLATLLKSSDNLYYVLYAAATCLLTQLTKKIFVNKVKVEILHKFDWATILPFLFGLVFAAIDLIFVRHIAFCWDFVVKLAVTAATVGALASVIFRMVSSLSGQSLKSLMKDDLFGVFYTQLLYFGNVRSQLLSGEISLRDFISQAKLLATNALAIYSDAEQTAPVKKDKLHRLLEGVISQQSISACVEVLNAALLAVTDTN